MRETWIKLCCSYSKNNKIRMQTIKKTNNSIVGYLSPEAAAQGNRLKMTAAKIWAGFHQEGRPGLLDVFFQDTLLWPKEWSLPNGLRTFDSSAAYCPRMNVKVLPDDLCSDLQNKGLMTNHQPEFKSWFYSVWSVWFGGKGICIWDSVTSFSTWE